MTAGGLLVDVSCLTLLITKSSRVVITAGGLLVDVSCLTLLITVGGQLCGHDRWWPTG